MKNIYEILNEIDQELETKRLARNTGRLLSKQANLTMEDK